MKDVLFFQITCLKAFYKIDLASKKIELVIAKNGYHPAMIDEMDLTASRYENIIKSSYPVDPETYHQARESTQKELDMMEPVDIQDDAIEPTSSI